MSLSFDERDHLIASRYPIGCVIGVLIGGFIVFRAERLENPKPQPSAPTPGDSPITDLLNCGQPSEFAEDITLMLLRLKLTAPTEILCLPVDANRWTLPDFATAGREFLYAALERHGIDTAYYRALSRRPT